MMLSNTARAWSRFNTAANGLDRPDCVDVRDWPIMVLGQILSKRRSLDGRENRRIRRAWNALMSAEQALAKAFYSA